MTTVAVQTHNFQHRLNWMLSSLVAQEDSPKVVFDIASLRNNGLYQNILDNLLLFPYHTFFNDGNFNLPFSVFSPTFCNLGNFNSTCCGTDSNIGVIILSNFSFILS